MSKSRREFIKGGAWIGAAALAAGCLNSKLKLFGVNGAPMQGFALPPMNEVRVGIVGVGSRGTGAAHRLPQIPGTRLVAVADLFEERISRLNAWLKENKFPSVCGYVGSESWKRICDAEDVNVIYIVAPWYLHARIAKRAMEHGKVSLVEVPGCSTVEECWDLVETSERTRIPCMMLENCCYGEEELLFLNMVKKGLLGEIIHGEAGYIHDARKLQFSKRYHSMQGDIDAFATGRPGWQLALYAERNGNLYPTHGLGPIARYMDINHGDRFDFVTSISSKSAGFQRYMKENFTDWRAAIPVKIGDMNQSLIRTVNGRSILLQLDTCTPRPYSRLNLVTGTKGILQSYPELKMAFESLCADGSTHRYFDRKKVEELRVLHMHPMWKTVGEIGRKIGGHGGMDFVMDLRWSYCLQNGLPLDIDVYDLASWSCLVELTEQSVAKRASSVDVPDFTRGAWKTAKPYGIDEIDLSRLQGKFREIKDDEYIRATMKSEGLS